MDKRAEIKQVLSEELEELKKRIINNHVAAGQVASGRTARSLRVEVTDDAATLYGRRAFGTLETGRKPGRVPQGFYQIILQWTKDKGIQVDNPKSFAYLVARKIAREGTRLYRNGGRTDIYSNEVEKTIENIMNRVFGVLDKEIEHIHLNSEIQ